RGMLADHEAGQARPVGELVLREVALVVRGGLLAIEEAVRKLEPERRVLVALLVGELVMRHLAEVVKLHRRDSPPRKSSTRRAKTSGCSIGGRWPHRSSTGSVEFGSPPRDCSPHPTGPTRSAPPPTIKVAFLPRGTHVA